MVGLLILRVQDEEAVPDHGAPGPEQQDEDDEEESEEEYDDQDDEEYSEEDEEDDGGEDELPGGKSHKENLREFYLVSPDSTGPF